MPGYEKHNHDTRFQRFVNKEIILVRYLARKIRLDDQPQLRQLARQSHAPAASSAYPPPHFLRPLTLTGAPPTITFTGHAARPRSTPRSPALHSHGRRQQADKRANPPGLAHCGENLPDRHIHTQVVTTKAAGGQHGADQ